MGTRVVDAVTVPAGDYPVGEGGRARLTAFRIGRVPVTNAAFAAYVADAGLERRFTRHRALWDNPLFADFPVVDVTWHDAREHCAWLAERLGTGVDLPSVAEWEAAARGAEGWRYPWGEHFDVERCPSLDGGALSLVPVGSFPTGASPCGALDMVGCVWQWTRDVDEDGQAIVKGGSWMDAAWGLRAARSLPADPARATSTTGFRVVVREEVAAPAP